MYRPHILAVEDESALAQFLGLVLGGPHCQVSTASDGCKALAKIEAAKTPFDLIITDHRMPNMNGLELVRELRARNFHGKIAVLSAYLTEENAHAYDQLGVDIRISKPFEVDELRHAVAVLLDNELATKQYATRF